MTGRAQPRSAATFTLLVALAACSHLTSEQECVETLQRADALRFKEKYEDAAKLYEQALEDDPHNLGAVRDYVEMFHLIGRTNVVLAHYKHEIMLHPNDAVMHYGLGLALFTGGGSQSISARNELEHAATMAPDVDDFQYRLGLYYVESDLFDLARGVLAKAIQLKPKIAKYRLPYALALARTGDRAGAVQQLATVLSLSPTPEEVARATKTAKELIDPFRGFPQAAREQFEIALNWLDHDATSQAKEVLDSLLLRYPDLAIVHALAGLTSAKMDDPSRALVELRKAIELDPDLAEPRMYIGDIYASHGRPDNAREYYEAALARNPFLADVYKHLAEVHVGTSDAAGGVGYYETYLLLKPDDVDAWLITGKILGDLQDAKASQIWDIMAERFPSRIDVLVGRGRYYFESAIRERDAGKRRKLKAEAEKSLQKAIEFDPENEPASALLARLKQLT